MTLFTLLLSPVIFSFAQINTDIFEKSASSTIETFQDQVRIIRPYDGGWDVSFEVRKGVYQVVDPTTQELLKASFEEKQPLTIEVNTQNETIVSAKVNKGSKTKSLPSKRVDGK